MGLFARTSSCAFQLTKRMLCDSTVATGFVKRLPKYCHKIVNAQRIGTTDITINQKLKSNEEIADEHWVEIRKELMKNYETLSESTVDSLVYDLCSLHKRTDQAKNYFKFLERNNYKITLGLLGRYLRFLAKDKELTKAEEQEIYRICDYIDEKHKLLDPKTCTDYIIALALTERWQEAYEKLDMLRFSDTPGSSLVAALCGAAFKHDKEEMAWKLMNEFITKYPMEHSVYSDYLDFCTRNFKGENLVEAIEKMFYFWRENDTIVVDFVMEKYMEALSTVGYRTSFAKILKENTCLNCRTNLQDTTLTPSEFKTLSMSVLKNVIIGKDVYHATSPQELKRYMLFIQTLKPYDVIIDGLNVAYATVGAERRGSLNNVLQVVNTFHRQNKRVLVIGRVHMRWWSVETMKQIEEKADVFLIKNISQDDPFLLHLCLVSGLQTYFVSRDLMRQHKFKLEKDSLKKLFKKWQLSRQYMTMANKKTKTIRLIPPVPVEANAQKTDDGWHIPCTRNPVLPLPVTYALAELWACLRRKKSLKK